MKHSSKPSVSGTSNETFLKTESASSLQGSAEPNSPDTSISNGGKTHPSKIDALKNWFRTRPIVEKFCALPTYIQSWGLTLFFMGTATIIAFCFFHALNFSAQFHILSEFKFLLTLEVGEPSRKISALHFDVSLPVFIGRTFLICSSFSYFSTLII